MKVLLFIVGLMGSPFIFAAPTLPQSPSPEILKQISEHNQQQALIDQEAGRLRTSGGEVIPFAEYEKTGYIFFNDDDYRGYAAPAKQTIAKSLPKDVTLVVYSTSTNADYLKRLKDKYLEFISESQLIILKIPPSGSNNFWARDNLPVPVWTEGEFTLVDARYYYNFEPDKFLSDLFSSLLSKHSYFFEGGNFTANARGECLVVNRRRAYPGGVSDTAAIPDSVFTNQYGCKKLTRFKHLKGIGHSDEVVKFMTDDIVVTDTEQYVEELESLGYEVHMLPEPDRRFETYVNSLQVNDILFVPSFDEKGDDKAVAVYEGLNLGLKVITIPTRLLATRGQGGIHCITMNYPPVPMERLLQDLSAEVIH